MLGQSAMVPCMLRDCPRPNTKVVTERARDVPCHENLSRTTGRVNGGIGDDIDA